MNLIGTFGALLQLLPEGGFDVIDRTLNYHYTDARWQQTADYGYLPNSAMQRTFLAVTIDLPDDLPKKANNQTTHVRYAVTSFFIFRHMNCVCVCVCVCEYTHRFHGKSKVYLGCWVPLTLLRLLQSCWVKPKLFISFLTVPPNFSRTIFSE